ncbi:Uncharacterised protein [Amycolatopsis camponoti]|uniref:Uncharacterized protein n=1 Tax=Amycolatopsis camponoti TaxID=2606593 RepID=A0A6I8LJZ4_9PSEU|nr:Uncharacterised protein [Amycolatopsis camponoti]
MPAAAGVTGGRSGMGSCGCPDSVGDTTLTDMTTLLLRGVSPDRAPGGGTLPPPRRRAPDRCALTDVERLFERIPE